MRIMKKGEYPYPMLLLELLPENEEVFGKTLEYLHNRGWTFGKGKSLLKFEPLKDDDRIFIYDDKTIRIGTLVSSKFCNPRFTIRINDKEKVVEDLAAIYEKWEEEILKKIKKGIMEGIYGKTSF